MENSSREEAVITAQFIKSTTQVSQTSVEDVEIPLQTISDIPINSNAENPSLHETVTDTDLVKPSCQIFSTVDKNHEESQETYQTEVPLTLQTKASLSVEPVGAAQHMRTTTLVLPSSVEEVETPAQPIIDDMPINLNPENSSLLEAVTETQIVKTSCQVLSTVDKNQEEPQETYQTEIPLTLQTKASLSMEPVSDTQHIRTTTLLLPTSVEDVETSAQPINDDIPINLTVENPSLLEAMTKTPLVKPSYQVLSTVTKNQEEPQQTYNAEIPHTLENKASLSIEPVSGTQHIQTTNMVLPTSVEIAEAPINDDIPVNLNAEDSSLLEEATETQIIKTSCQVFSAVDENQELTQETYKKDIPLTLDDKTVSHTEVVNDAQQAATLASSTQIDKEPDQSCRDELSTTAFLENKAEEKALEIAPKDSALVSTSSTEHAKGQTFECSDCGKRFTDERILSIHQRVHTYNSAKPYTCKYCGKAFSGSNNLLMHIRRHTGEKPYECSICSKTFIDIFPCRVHMRTHTGEKPYECSVCGKKFTQPSNLSSHMKTHSTERPYQCDVCRRGFLRSSNLAQHMQTHEVCEKRTRKVQKNRKKKAPRCHQCLEPCTKKRRKRKK